ncbi:hypothetical protein D9613_012348 [Agrocybe pediades]|uniref:Fungal-type protein kinase domain-containing protein n=1 Tax=Agrocybe pediades TaxID=84607 RepID=A0A8H4QF13_9AGAR|nr:hypothetical protein D9613_012348 [Agrocybe pediades]
MSCSVTCASVVYPSKSSRLFRRVTVENGGSPLVGFTTPEEVLYALRDAIQGHKNLWDEGILHRDVSVNNILIARSGKIQRGTLIDLDMAMPIDRSKNLAGTHRAGTYRFESPGKLRKDPPPYFEEWKATHYNNALNSKVVFFIGRKLPSAPLFFGPIFDQLIEEFRLFLSEKVLGKFKSRDRKFPALESFKDVAQEHYDEVLAIFDKAIVAMEADEGFKARNQLPPPEECKTPEKNGTTHRRRSVRIEARRKSVPYSRPDIQEEGQGGTSGKNAKAKKGKPYCYRETIMGRGTICWKVDSGRLVKDQWTSEERTPESELPERAKGLPFVGQMVSFATGTSTAKLRGFDSYENDVSDENKEIFRNRIFRRFTLKNGGKPLVEFSTPEEVVYALRNAVQGHKNLWDKGILHRDISINNILIANSGTVHQRGTLIDLDMAILIDRTSSLASTDFRMGTRAFQSASVLSSALESDYRNELYPHDYLDDFESVFYVLCWMAEGSGYERPGKHAARRPKYLDRWTNLDYENAVNSKVAFFNKRKHPKSQAFFGPIFNNLISDFLTFLRRKVLDKNASDYPRFTTPESLQTIAQQHYDEVLAIFDKAIVAMEADEGFKARNKASSSETCKIPEENEKTLCRSI